MKSRRGLVTRVRKRQSRARGEARSVQPRISFKLVALGRCPVRRRRHEIDLQFDFIAAAKLRQHLNHQVRIRITRIVKKLDHMRGVLRLAAAFYFVALGLTSFHTEQASRDFVLDYGSEAHSMISLPQHPPT